MGLKGFNRLPTYIKDISYNVKEFIHLSKNFLYLNSFYMSEIYYQYNNTWDVIHSINFILLRNRTIFKV